MKIIISSKLNKLAKIFSADNPLFVVGGYVRNSLMKYPCSDIDLASSLKVCEVAKLLQGTEYNIEVKNQALNTCKITCGKESYEYATFRREVYKKGGYHTPSQITFDATIVEDVARRDFSCNSLYYEIIEDKLIDFYGGENDIKAKKLKTVETPDIVLKNDGLRMMRLVRFASEFNFVIDGDTYLAAEKYKDNLKNISKDRIREEFIKILNANHTYKKYDRKTLFNKHRGYNGIKLIDKLNLWQYFSKNEKIVNMRGVGAHLSAFVKEKDLSLVAFAVDAFVYLKNSQIINSPKEYIDLLWGEDGLNLSRKDKAEINNIIKVFDKLDSLPSEPLAKQKDYVSKYVLPNDKIMAFVKAKGSRRYLYIKQLLNKLKKEKK